MRWAPWALMIIMITMTACVNAPTNRSTQACAEDDLALEYVGEPDPEPGEPEPAILDRERSRCLDVARADPSNG